MPNCPSQVRNQTQTFRQMRSGSLSLMLNSSLSTAKALHPIHRPMKYAPPCPAQCQLDQPTIKTNRREKEENTASEVTRQNDNMFGRLFRPFLSCAMLFPRMPICHMLQIEALLAGFACASYSSSSFLSLCLSLALSRRSDQA